MGASHVDVLKVPSGAVVLTAGSSSLLCDFKTLVETHRAHGHLRVQRAMESAYCTLNVLCLSSSLFVCSAIYLKKAIGLASLMNPSIIIIITLMVWAQQINGLLWVCFAH